MEQEKKKISIPEMTPDEIMKLYSHIKPIVWRDGKRVYLRQLCKKEAIDQVFTKIESEGEEEKEVNYSELAKLADIRMLHRWGYHMYFKPSVGEVIRQIPKEMINDVVAFQLLHGSTSNLFKETFNAGYHTSVVRLYKTKGKDDIAAEPPKPYPNKDTVKPIGMTDEEFTRFYEFFRKD